MAIDKKPLIYSDRSHIGSADELDEYGVWVKSEPQDLPSNGYDTDSAGFSMDDPGLADFDDIEQNFGSEPDNFGDSSDLSDLMALSSPLDDFDPLPIPDSFDDDTESPFEAASEDDFDSFSLPDNQDSDITDDTTSIKISDLDDFVPLALPDEAFGTASSKARQDDLSTQLLMKIAEELSYIRLELSDMKKEFASVQSVAKIAAVEENIKQQEKLFLDDEKITLTGDELNNILNTADFLEETGDSGSTSEDFAPDTENDDSFEALTADDNENISTSDVFHHEISAIVCGACGKDFPENTKACSNCGASLQFESFDDPEAFDIGDDSLDLPDDNEFAEFSTPSDENDVTSILQDEVSVLVCGGCGKDCPEDTKACGRCGACLQFESLDDSFVNTDDVEPEEIDILDLELAETDELALDADESDAAEHDASEMELGITEMMDIENLDTSDENDLDAAETDELDVTELDTVDENELDAAEIDEIVLDAESDAAETDELALDADESDAAELDTTEIELDITEMDMEELDTSDEDDLDAAETDELALDTDEIELDLTEVAMEDLNAFEDESDADETDALALDADESDAAELDTTEIELDITEMDMEDIDVSDEDEPDADETDALALDTGKSDVAELDADEIELDITEMDMEDIDVSDEDEPDTAETDALALDTGKSDAAELDADEIELDITEMDMEDINVSDEDEPDTAETDALGADESDTVELDASEIELDVAEMDMEDVDVSDEDTESKAIETSDIEDFSFESDEEITDIESAALDEEADLVDMDFSGVEETDDETLLPTDDDIPAGDEDDFDTKVIPEAFEAETEKKSAKQAFEIPPTLKNELKTVLSYMDQLLESLPEEKIEEFAKSKHFESYKKLFKELGLV